MKINSLITKSLYNMAYPVRDKLYYFIKFFYIYLLTHINNRLGILYWFIFLDLIPKNLTGTRKERA